MCSYARIITVQTVNSTKTEFNFTILKLENLKNIRKAASSIQQVVHRHHRDWIRRFLPLEVLCGFLSGNSLVRLHRDKARLGTHCLNRKKLSFPDARGCKIHCNARTVTISTYFDSSEHDEQFCSIMLPSMSWGLDVKRGKLKSSLSPARLGFTMRP